MSYFIFAGGGTGGHLFPALAVVEKLRALPGPDVHEVAFFCTQRQIDADILGKAGIRAMPLSVRAFPSRPWHWPGFYLRWRESVAACVRHFHEHRPAAVIGAGGYASGPPVHAAMQLGIPTFLLNPDAVPGRANRHMGSKAGISGIFAQWDVTRRYFRAHAPVRVTGCPVRASFLAAIEPCRSRPTRFSAPGASSTAQPPLAPPSKGGDGGGDRNETLASCFGLDAARRTLLVTGASQGARTINEAMIRLAPLVASAGWQVLHLAGAVDADPVRQAYASAGMPAAVLTFTDKMAEAMLLADLIISRAGASSLAEILAVGRPSILMPYPFHRDQHQRHNGQVLVDAGAAVMLQDTKDGATNSSLLEPVLGDLLHNHTRREAMGAAALALSRPDAADRIASILVETAGLSVSGAKAGEVASMIRAA